MSREEACDGTPHHGSVELAGRKVFLDQLAGVKIGVRVEDPIRYSLIDKAVLGEPVRSWGAVVHADAQPLLAAKRNRAFDP